MYAVHEDCVAAASAFTEALPAVSAFADEGLDAEAGLGSACNIRLVRYCLSYKDPVDALTSAGAECCCVSGKDRMGSKSCSAKQIDSMLGLGLCLVPM